MDTLPLPYQSAESEATPESPDEWKEYIRRRLGALADFALSAANNLGNDAAVTEQLEAAQQDIADILVAMHEGRATVEGAEEQTGGRAEVTAEVLAPTPPAAPEKPEPAPKPPATPEVRRPRSMESELDGPTMMSTSTGMRTTAEAIAAFVVQKGYEATAHQVNEAANGNSAVRPEYNPDGKALYSWYGARHIIAALTNSQVMLD